MPRRSGESLKMEEGNHIYRVILIGLAGVALGVLANNWMTARRNRRALERLAAEKVYLESKNGSLTEIERRLLDRLQTEIYIMKFRCDA